MSLSALAAAIAPKVYASSTTGVKKSVVTTRARSGRRRTTAALSPDAYNASILVDHEILLDAGAPLTVHLPRAGVSLDAPRAVLLSHFHADHTFGLAWLMLGRVLSNDHTPPLSVYGPVGTTAYLRQLLDLAWGEEMRRLSWGRLQLTVQELPGGLAFEADGSRGTAFTMKHARRMN